MAGDLVGDGQCTGQGGASAVTCAAHTWDGSIQTFGSFTMGGPRSSVVIAGRRGLAVGGRTLGKVLSN